MFTLTVSFLLYALSNKGCSPFELTSSLMWNKECKEVLLSLSRDEHTAPTLELTHRDALTELHVAAINNQPATMNFVRSRLKDLEKEDNYGRTPLFLAAGLNNTSLLRVLLAEGANPNRADRTCQLTPFHIALFNHHLAQIEALVGASANVDKPILNKLTPLQYGVEKANRALVMNLLDQGANPSGASPDGFTPLHYAVQAGNGELTRILLQKGAEVNAASKGSLTPLDLALGSMRYSTPLLDAQRSKSLALIALLLDFGADVQFSKGSFLTNMFFFAASMKGDYELAMILLKAYAKAYATVGSRNENYMHPLFFAIFLKDYKLVQEFVHLGDITKNFNGIGGTPLHVAADLAELQKDHEGSEQIIPLLLDAGADVQALNNDGKTALHRAALSGNKVSVEALLSAGAHVNVKSTSGNTPLHKAAMSKNGEQIIPLLLDAGADVRALNNDGETALHRAALSGNKVSVEALLSAGAHVNVKSTSGNTPLHNAAMSKNGEQIILLLLNAGADVQALNNYGETALHSAAGYRDPSKFSVGELGSCGTQSLVEVLIKAGSSIDAQDKNNDTPLHRALRCFDSVAAQTIISRGAQVNLQNSDGRTPLHEAIQYPTNINIDTALLLLDKGALPSVQDINGDTALHIAASKFGLERLTKKLVEAKADVNARGRHSFTALHMAAFVDEEKTISLLVQLGADVNALADRGYTPLDIAVKRGNHKAAEELTRLGGKHCSLLAYIFGQC